MLGKEKKLETYTTIVLGLSGILLTMVGLLRLTKPINTYSKNSGITLSNDVNLLNEIRGVSAVMLCSGVVIFFGAFLSQTRIYSIVVAIIIFIGFAVGRLISVIVDGKPNKQLMQGLIFELVFGMLNIFAFLNIAE